jgi:hypothetical protein
MLIVEFEKATAPPRVEAKNGSIEWYSREDGDGLLAVTNERTIDAPSGKTHAVTPLFTLGEYGAAAGPHLFYLALRVPEDYRNEFLAWYESEHLPMLLEAKGWDGCRFVEEPVNDGLLFHALHQLRDLSALESAERKRSRATPWFGRLAKNAWFDSGFVRSIYRRITP